ncbi:hypothetical protein DENSPDRAFT_810109 [Dentipellis sp. KUC8613]|nr:hypothetical protein DENSPDRAFT_810109 [Dentipellis sp. KUC8613]
MAVSTPAGMPIIDREKTAPFLIRAFVKVGGHHRLAQFQDGPQALPIADEQQIYTWKDATLAEVLTTLRNVGPQTPEFRHPLARYSFRAVYADAGNRGLFAQKDLGIVYSRDILGEPGTLDGTARRLLEDKETGPLQKDARTLEELRFVPGDYMCITVLLPKSATIPAPGGELTIKGSGAAAAAAANGWKNAPAPALDRSGPPPPIGRGGGGHWRGGSDAPSAPGRGRGGRGDIGRPRERDLDRTRDDRFRDDRMRDERDRRPPPPRRGESPPPRRGWGERDRDRGYRDRRSRSPSRSRSPIRRRR